MSDITVTLNPPNSTSVTIGNAAYPHGATHAAGGSDSLSGYYYPANNPSGYATSGDFATTGYVGDVSGAIVSQISFPQNVVFTTGDQSISGIKNFYSRPTVNGTGVLLSGEASAASTGYLTGYVSKTETGIFYPISNPSGYITGVNLSSYQTIVGSTGISGYLQGQISAIDISALETATGILNNHVLSLESETGNYYLASNPSGYITGVDLSSYATVSLVTGVSGDLQDQISTLNSQTGSYVTSGIVRPSDTGAFYAASNPSGYITGVDLSSYQTIAASTGISGFLDGQISTLETATGDLNNRSIKTMFISGTSLKTVTLVRWDDSQISTSFTDISGDFSGASGYLQGQVDTLNNLTGSTIYSSDTGVFYPISNPSGYITGVDLSNYSTIGYVTGVSGYLGGEISSLQSATGSYLTGENDPVFAASVAFNIDSSLTGNWGTSYNESITGINVAGSTTKTITLYQRSGGTLTADFTDSEGTGAGADFYIYSGSFDSGNGNLTLNRTGDGGSVVIPLDGRYSTGPFVTGISGYLQDQIGAINLSALEAATGNLDGRVSSIESQTGSYITGSVIRPEDTGVFYTNDNPSGYITGIDLSSYQTVTVSTGISGFLQNQISSLNGATGNLNTRVSAIEAQTGNFALKNDTGAFLTTGAADLRFYPLSSNPSSYLVAADIASLASTGYVTGVSGYLQGEINTLNSTTGLLYPRNNPSGYITGVDLSSYALQSSVNSINAQSGQWITGYNKSITGLSFAGTDTKTLTLYSQDGSNLSANFADLQGTGADISSIVYQTGDQDISGAKNFYSRPTVNGSGVVLSGEIYPVVREIYIDAGAMLNGVSGASPSTISVSNSGIAYDCFNFDPATTGYAQFKVKLGDYNLGGIKAKFDWTTSGTGGGIVWGIQGMAVNDSGSFSSAWGTSQESSDTFTTGTGLHQTSGTSAITLGGSPQSNSLLCFQIYRNVYNASDTLAVNAGLLGIKLQYTGTSIQPW